MSKILFSSSAKKAVVISANDENGPFRANLYVNCNPSIQNHNGLGDITLVAKSGARLATVEKWAQNQLV